MDHSKGDFMKIETVMAILTICVTTIILGAFAFNAIQMHTLVSAG